METTLVHKTGKFNNTFTYGERVRLFFTALERIRETEGESILCNQNKTAPAGMFEISHSKQAIINIINQKNT